MFGYGPGWDYFEIMGRIASVLVGSILFLIWLAVLVLLVRFLLIGTRAAKAYLRNHGQHDGILPNRVGTAPATTTAPSAAPAAPATKPAPRPRTPKTP